MPPVVCVGELLFDELPAGRVPGGAPLNVAVGLVRLGVECVLVSRVGADEAGAELRRAVEAYGLDPRHIQTDDKRPSGRVTVDPSDPRAPKYTIHEPAAWDGIRASETVLDLAKAAPAVYAGTLARRGGSGAATAAVFKACPNLRVVDVNLRPPFHRTKPLDAALRSAALVKLTGAEFKAIRARFKLNDWADFWARYPNLSAAVETNGERGATWHSPAGGWYCPAEPATVIDTIGAGDAFTAGMLAASLSGATPAEALRAGAVNAALACGRAGAL